MLLLIVTEDILSKGLQAVKDLIHKRNLPYISSMLRVYFAKVYPYVRYPFANIFRIVP